MNSNVILRRACALVLCAALFVGFAQPAGAGTREQLQRAQNKLAQLEQDIREARSVLQQTRREARALRPRLRALQQELNALAARLSVAQGRYEHTRDLITTTHDALVTARLQYQATRARIDTRARDLYERGPGSGLEFIFGAESLADLTARVEFVSAIESQDADLANQAQNLANTLRAREAELQRLRARQEQQLRELRDRQRELYQRFQEQQRLLDSYNAKRDEAASLLTRMANKKQWIMKIVDRFRNKLAAEERAAALAAERAANSAHSYSPTYSGDGPFRECPVQGPHAYSDSFGAPRYAGGYHPHAGNDIFAPRGTPIVAPFDGYASADPNGLGGNAVIVSGSQGYVYNAHLDHYGSLGSVSAGTVIGYVGNSGDAQGGATHDHFEWHPDSIPSNPWRSPYGYTVIGSAIDPYPYLNQVC